VLRKEIFSNEELEAIVKDFRHAGLPAEEVAIMAFAQKVIREPGAITPGEVDELRSFGLSDEEILDIVTAAAARSFFSKTLDALAAVPDVTYLQLDEHLRRALAVGRPFPPDNGW
jgi:alkylhydroperoxidase family enzyme